MMRQQQFHRSKLNFSTLVFDAGNANKVDGDSLCVWDQNWLPSYLCCIAQKIAKNELITYLYVATQNLTISHCGHPNLVLVTFRIIVLPWNRPVTLNRLQFSLESAVMTLLRPTGNGGQNLKSTEMENRGERKINIRC